MTLKESLFNKGIYINTLRRFKWGSVLYFIILFLAAPFVFLTTTQEAFIGMRGEGVVVESYLLRDIPFVFPVVSAMIVPTVVVLMAFFLRELSFL